MALRCESSTPTRSTCPPICRPGIRILIFSSNRCASRFARASFGGRHISVALPASAIQIKHVRISRGEGPEVQTQIAEQVVAQLGGEPADWFIRSAVAGEVSGEAPPQQEAIAFATPRATIDQLIEDAASARVELAGVQVQPRVIAAAFGEIHRRKADVEAVNLFADLGGSGTRAIVAAPIALKFVRDVPVRVADLHNRVARSLSIDPAAATILRRAAIARQTGTLQRNQRPRRRRTGRQCRADDEAD